MICWEHLKIALGNYKFISAKRRTVFDPAGSRKTLTTLEQQTAAPGFWDDNKKAHEVTSRIAEIKETLLVWEALIKDSEALLELAKESLPAGREEEQREIEERFREIERAFQKEKQKLFLFGKYDKGAAVLSVYAGAGGDDAEDWAGILLDMFTRYAGKQGWDVTTLHYHRGEGKGIKNATVEIEGKFVYGYLKGEAGVHRLVRISPFSARKLRHTSFVMVEVLPKLVLSDEVSLNLEDIEIRFARSSGPGGQNVNKRETAVHAKHKPTGIQVHVEQGRSQAANKERAIELLRSKLYQRMFAEEKKTIEELSAAKGAEIEWGHQIRSYVFHPYKMVKDHRTNVETSDVDAVLAGNLDAFIEAELSHRQ
ncbi:MAG: peptide chain release factor 2 [Candidatus Niyogibacteria bacterium]|nr:peptide chain release factor 2 [Candidatus Niyogibacteria bacterium]